MVKVKILKSFAWYKEGEIIDTMDDHLTRILEKLGMVKVLEGEARA